MSAGEILSAWSMIWLHDWLRYVVAAGGMYLVAWVWLKRKLEHRRIHADPPPRGSAWREFGWSMSTVLIFSLNGLGIYALVHAGVFHVYRDIAEYGWAYFAASLALVVLVHDAYFYWTHRLLHHPKWFARVHAIHHRSHNPTPWAAYAFHPLEGAIQAIYLPLILLALPLHSAVIFLFMLHMIVRNVLGHGGYEWYPRGAASSRTWGWLTSPTHHHLHHSAPKGNYGLYFSWWDRLCGTECPEYAEVFNRVTSRLAPARRLVGGRS